jgi:hypothetical protein
MNQGIIDELAKADLGEHCAVLAGAGMTEWADLAGASPADLAELGITKLFDRNKLIKIAKANTLKKEPRSKPSRDDPKFWERPCKYFASRAGCRRGADCRYQHIEAPQSEEDLNAEVENARLDALLAQPRPEYQGDEMCD